jgi:hypothetical protein
MSLYSKIVFILFVLFASNFSLSQTTEVEWIFSTQDSLLEGDQVVGKDSYIDNLGNKYVCGSFEKTTDFDLSVNFFNLTPPFLGKDIFIVKYDSQGNFLWGKGIGGDLQDVAVTITGNSSNEILVSGNFMGTVDFDPSFGSATLTSNGSEDIFLVKFDNQGNFIWVKQFGGLLPESVIDVRCDNLDNVFLTGSFQTSGDFGDLLNPIVLTSNGATDIFLLKIDNFGDIDWGFSIGSTSYDYPKEIEIDENNIVHLVGEYVGNIDLDPSPNTSILNSSTNGRSFIGKYNSLGEYIWSQGFFGFVTSVGISAEKDFYLTGDFSGTIDFDPSMDTVSLTSYGSSDVFFSKYDSLGLFIWCKSIKGNGLDHSNSILLDLEENIYLTGNFSSTQIFFDPNVTFGAPASAQSSSNSFIAKYDSLGNYLWRNTFGGSSSDIGVNILFDSDSNIFYTSQFFGEVDFDPSFSMDILSATFPNGAMNTFDTMGNLLEASCFNNYGPDYAQMANKVVSDSQGNIYLFGGFAGTVDFDPSASVSNINSGGSFLAKYDSNGNFIWAKGMDGVWPSETHLLLDANENLILAGVYGLSADFDASVNLSVLSSEGPTDCFIASFDQNGNLINAVDFGSLGSYFTSINHVELDHLGHLVLAGTYSGTADFDPSPGSTILTSVANSDEIFIANYTTTGVLLWVKDIRGSFDEHIGEFELDSVSNIYCTGMFRGAADFDPSSGIFELNTNGTASDIFIAKYDISGNLIWAKNIGSNQSDEGLLITLNDDQELILSGYYRGTVDFDPSSNIANLNSPITDFFLAKYSNDGDYIWAHQYVIPVGTILTPMKLLVDSLNNIVFFTMLIGEIDFDFSTNVNSINSNLRSIPVVKYDNDANLIWAKKFSGSGECLMGDAAFVEDGKLVLVGQFEGESNFDNDLTSNVSTLNNRDAFCLKFHDCLPSLGAFYYSVCDSFFCSQDQQYYTQTGNYSVTTSCGSTFILDLTVNQSNTGIDYQLACDSLTWIDGITYYLSTNTPTWVLQNSTGCDSLVSLNLIIELGMPTEIENMFSLPSSDLICNGSFAIEISGNPDFELTTNSITQSTSGYSLFTNLCPGVNDLQILNSCGDTTNVQYVVPIDSNYVLNNAFLDSLAQDSLGVTLTNCEIYYNNIDTAFIDSIWAVGNNVTVIWNIVDSNGSNYDTTTYVLNNGSGVYWLQLSIFCPTKALGEYFTVTEAVYFDNGDVSLANLYENASTNIQVFPNPTDNTVTVTFGGNEAELKIFDTQGKLLYESTIHNNQLINVSYFETGIYFFQVLIDNKLNSVKKVLKQ